MTYTVSSGTLNPTQLNSTHRLLLTTFSILILLTGHLELLHVDNFYLTPSVATHINLKNGRVHMCLQGRCRNSW